jgi:nicotinate-nucleotide pyrophosphorylase (carboxylating)
MTPENLAGYARAGVDFISSGALTHSVRALDLSLIFTAGDVMPRRDPAGEGR